jgi:3-hydroxy acid dehydrogenase / malonic semialdehyde reductase
MRTFAAGKELNVTDGQSSMDWARGRVALITGASSGFGAALARRVVAGGGRLVAIARRADRLEALQAELGVDACAMLPMDLTVPGAIDALPARLEAELPAPFGAVDILFNNAGLALGFGKAQDAVAAGWDQMIDTNVRALVHLTRVMLPGMLARGRGHIVNVGSVAGSYPYPFGNVYAGTKAFVRQFSLALRSDLLGTPIRVTVVEPGMCETEFSLVRFDGDATKAAAVYQGMRPLSADDVAETVEAVLRLPAHVNVNIIEVMPVQQAFGPFAVDRSSPS